MSKFDDYLANVARQMRHLPAPVREAETREIRSHLEQLRDDFAASGQNSEMTEESALAQFGEARTVGIRLRDVWEGQDFGWKRVLAALVCGSTFWVGAIQALFFGASNFYFWSQHRLFPEVLPLILASFWLIPFLTGILFSAWLGRRAWILSAVFFTVGTAFITGALYEFAVALNSLSIRFYFAPINFPFWTTVCSCGVGVVGALAGSAFPRRRRYAKLAMGAAPTSWTIKARPEKWPLKIALALVALLGILIGGSWRIGAALHPRTPIAALRARLLSPDISRYNAPKVLELRELAPQTRAERDGAERRVAFHLELSATKDYVASRVSYLQKLLTLPTAKEPINRRAFQASLRRARANDYRIRGVATIKKNRDGWRVEEKSFDASRLRAWLEDLYFVG